MKKIIFNLVLALTSLTAAVGAHAQYARTNFVDLRSGTYVALSNCNFYADYQDRSDCYELRRNAGNYNLWANQAYAVDCYRQGYPRHQQRTCIGLSQRLNSNRYIIDCRSEYGTSLDMCETTQEAYRRGYFGGSSYHRGTTIETTTTTSRPRVVESTVVDSRVVTTSCNTSYYDRSFNEYEAYKKRKRGNTRVAVGTIAVLGGLILGNSNDRTTRTIGTGVAVGGAVLATAGLIDLAEANLYLPHADPMCRGAYVQETRRVVVERQECTSTRYTERGFGSSRSYYEVNCSNKRYVTFEKFDAWENGYAY